jgi:di- and tripeptidase
MDTGAGDIFTLVWSPALQTIFFGCQNTSLQWLHFPAEQTKAKTPLHSISRESSRGATPRTPPRAAHKFFDSYPQYQRRAADLDASNPFIKAVTNALESDGCVKPGSGASTCIDLEVPIGHVIDSAHYGYIYCMAVMPSSRQGSDDGLQSTGNEAILVTGSGDECVKVS